MMFSLRRSFCLTSILFLSHYANGTAQTSSVLTTPAKGSTVAPQQVNFAWTSVPGATEYTLWVGTAPLSDNAVYFGTSQTGNPAGTTSTTASLVAGTTYYVTMWTDNSGSWTYTTSSFQTAATSYLTAPAQGATVSPVQISLAWTAISGATSYTLWIGTSPGAKDALYFGTANKANPTATSTTATLQPGRTYYVTLWTNVSGTWSSTLSSFSTTSAAYLTAPSQGKAVSAQQVNLAWTTSPCATGYTLWLGTAPGTSNALYFGSPTATSATVTLQPGTEYYATLWTNCNGSWSSTTSSFSTSAASYVSIPAQVATVSPQNTQISWTSSPGASAYTLWVGTSPGARDALYYAAGTATSATVSLQPGRTYYTTLWTNANGTWSSTSSSFNTASTAYVISPAQSATVSPQVTFSWASVPNATQYTVWVGTSPGSYNAAYLPATGNSVSAMLLPGTTYYTTLWTDNSGSWSSTSSSFQTSQIAVLTSPSSGATGLDSGAPISFNWTSIPGATEYQLDIGSSAGGKSIYSTGGTTATSASATLQPNTTYYARMWTDTAGSWTHTDSVFATGNSLAHLTYPLNGATGVDLYKPLTWTQPPNTNGYNLTVSPTGYGVTDFWTQMQRLIPSATSSYIWDLQPNTLYYVQLCTGIDGAPGGGSCVDSQFTTGPGPAPPSNASAFYQLIQSLTAQVRLMAQEGTDLAVPGTYLYQFMYNHSGDTSQGAACGWFAAVLLDEFNMNGITGRQRNISLDGLDGHVITEYWDPFNQKWSIADPTFGAVYFDPTSQVGQSAEDVSALVQAQNFNEVNVLFVTSNNSSYMTGYYLDPLTMYNNVDPFGMLDATAQLNNVPNSPVPLLTDITTDFAGLPWQPLVFYFPSSSDSVTVEIAGVEKVTIVPGNTEGWAPAVHLANWTYVTPVPSGLHVYSMNRYRF